MLQKSIVVLLLFCCFQLYSNDSTAQEPQNKSEPSGIKKLFASDATSIQVYRKNHPQGRSSTIYNVRIESLCGLQYLVGTNKLENHDKTYWYLLSDVQLISIVEPVPESESDEKKPESVADQALSLKSQWLRRLKSAKSQQSYAVNKRSIIRSLEKKIDNEQTEIAERYKEEKRILEKEVKLHQSRYNDLMAEVPGLKLRFLDKRAEAIEKGEHSSQMEIR